MIPLDNPASPVAATGKLAYSLYLVSRVFIFAVGLDFCEEEVIITFVADENLTNPVVGVTTYVNITDDAINEADQVFLLAIEAESVPDESDAVVIGGQSLCKIIDDDGKRTILA
jgi:hypothetical protein